MIPGQDAFLHGIKPQLRIIQTQGTAIQPGKGTWMSNDFSQSEKSRETCTFEVRTQNDLYDSIVCIMDILQIFCMQKILSVLGAVHESATERLQKLSR